MKPFNYTDEHGVTHIYPSFVSRWCDAHKRECSPWKPVTTTDLLTMAARDERLDDDTFGALAGTIGQQED